RPAAIRWPPRARWLRVPLVDRDEAGFRSASVQLENQTSDWLHWPPCSCPWSAAKDVALGQPHQLRRIDSASANPKESARWSAWEPVGQFRSAGRSPDGPKNPLAVLPDSTGG